MPRSGNDETGATGIAVVDAFGFNKLAEGRSASALELGAPGLRQEDELPFVVVVGGEECVDYVDDLLSGDDIIRAANREDLRSAAGNLNLALDCLPCETGNALVVPSIWLLWSFEPIEDEETGRKGRVHGIALQTSDDILAEVFECIPRITSKSPEEIPIGAAPVILRGRGERFEEQLLLVKELVDEFVVGEVLPMKPPHDPPRGVYHVIHLRPVARELIEGETCARIEKRRNRLLRLLPMITEERRNRLCQPGRGRLVPAFAPPCRQNLQKVRIDPPHRGNRRPQFVILVFHLGLGNRHSPIAGMKRRSRLMLTAGPEKPKESTRGSVRLTHPNCGSPFEFLRFAVSR